MLQGLFGQLKLFVHRLFSPPDYTVGSGFTPDQPLRLAGLTSLARKFYRRFGIEG